MKTKLMVLALLLLALSALPALAQDGLTNSVTFNGFSFSYDLTLATNLDIAIYAGDAPDLQAPGGPDPRRALFTLYNGGAGDYVPSIWESAGGIIVYRTADFAGYEFPSARLAQLQALLAERPDLAQYMAYDSQSANSLELPLMPVMPAGQVIRARAEYVDTTSFSGIRYLTVYRQDASPFLANEFRYVYQGVSADGSTYVSAIFPVVAPNFPADYDPNFDYEAFMATHDQYMNDSIAQLNAAAPADFSPALPQLDVIIASFTIQPSTAPVVTEPAPEVVEPTEPADELEDPTMAGLAGTVWTLVSYGSPEAPVAALADNPATLQFTAGGAIGNGGCNQFGGDFQYDNNSLTFGPLASTMMACAPEVMEQEAAYLSALGTATGFSIADGMLQITYPEGVLVFAAS